MVTWDMVGSREKVRIGWRMKAFHIFRRLKIIVLAVNGWVWEDISIVLIEILRKMTEEKWVCNPMECKRTKWFCRYIRYVQFTSYMTKANETGVTGFTNSSNAA